MRWATLLLLVGCRQILGLHDPQREQPDASFETDAALDGPVDAGFIAADAALDCAVLPMTPPNHVIEHENGTITTLEIRDFGFGDFTTKYFVGAAGAVVTAQFNWSYTDTSCAGACIDQIEIGYVPGDRVACPFDGSVSKTAGATGSVMQMLTLPTTPGWTSVRIAIGQNFSCTANGAHTWYEGVPPDADVVGNVCVH